MGQDQSVVIPPGWIWSIRLLAGAAGLAAGFILGPLADLLHDNTDAIPGALRLVAGLPLLIAVPALTLAGLVLGIWIAYEWQSEIPVVTVGPDKVMVAGVEGTLRVGVEQIGGVFSDGHDLVIVDHRSVDLVRVKTDSVLDGRLRRTFEAADYPWQDGGDPREGSFTTWVDGDRALDPQANALLRSRSRSLADQRPGEAADTRDALRRLGVSVRDRKSGQQYRPA